jgi:hypothetical protein
MSTTAEMGMLTPNGPMSVTSEVVNVLAARLVEVGWIAEIPASFGTGSDRLGQASPLTSDRRRRPQHDGAGEPIRRVSPRLEASVSPSWFFEVAGAVADERPTVSVSRPSGLEPRATRRRCAGSGCRLSRPAGVM